MFETKILKWDGTDVSVVGTCDHELGRVVSHMETTDFDGPDDRLWIVTTYQCGCVDLEEVDD
jgi:hypothetical protein